MTVCYQQLNLLLYAWLHKDIVKKDGTLNGWQRWANASVEGAKKPGNEKYGFAYRDIPVHGDLYPEGVQNLAQNRASTFGGAVSRASPGHT